MDMKRIVLALTVTLRGKRWQLKNQWTRLASHSKPVQSIRGVRLRDRMGD
jgi:hypothetical protein